MRVDPQSSAIGSLSPLTQRPSIEDHFGFFDVMRAVAIVAIVWIHAADSPTSLQYRDIGRFGVPFFVMGAILFQFQSLRRKPDQPFAGYAWRRFRRLYVPFLIWSLIYIAARILKHRAFHAGIPFVWRPVLLYVGPAHHLWFLPFLFIVNLALFYPARAVIARPALKWPVVVVSLVVAIGVGQIRTSIPQLIETIPGISWATIGVAFATLFPEIRSAVQTRAAAVIGAIMAIVSIAADLHWGRHALLESAAGLGTLIVALQPIAVPAAIFTSIGRHAFEIYLNHVLFVEGIEAVFVRLHIASTPAIDLLVLVLSVALGFALSVLVQTIRGKPVSS